MNGHYIVGNDGLEVFICSFPLSTGLNSATEPEITWQLDTVINKTLMNTAVRPNCLSRCWWSSCLVSGMGDKLAYWVPSNY